MPLLSIIIVSFNVRAFLEQCLVSVLNSAKGTDAEIIVIDNNSADQTVEILSPLFPGVRFVKNDFNVGYAKANNQGLALATGELILFLNPDTLLGEECLQTVTAQFQKKFIGACGIKMINGSGRFLPESKRGFPSPLTSLFKLSGLIRLFPASPKIARYYMGHLPEDQNNEVDVLSGAFLMVRKEILDNISGFDESFFMYGEDIDLSYRIQQAGYANLYISSPAVIHFKGESTPRSNKYIFHFYDAMRIFARKHFRQHSWIYSGLISLIIPVRQFFNLITTPLIPVKQKKEASIVFVKGGDDEIEEVKMILVRESRPVRITKDRDEATEIIFCTGTYSWQSAIDELKTLKRGVRASFHAAGTETIVISHFS